MIDGKIPPQAVEIEKAVLGAMMLEKDLPAVVIGRLFEDAFYLTAHQKCFLAIRQLFDKSIPADMMTVIQQLKSNNDLETVGGPYEITKLTSNVTSTANIDAHISILLECYIKREAIKISGDLMALSYENGTDAFEIINKATDAFIKAQEKALKGGEKTMMHFVMKVAENRDRVLATGSIGLKTGFNELNKVIGGWVEPDLVIIAARPGMGKTALMLSTLHDLAVIQKRPGAVFSLEMSGEQLTERLEAIDSLIDHRNLRYNQMNDGERGQLLETEKKLSTAPIFIDDRGGINIRDIRTKATLWKRKYKIEYVLIDYLQLLSGDEKGKSREQVISDASRGCKMLAKELNVPVIALSQLSRAVEARGDKMPQLSDLRESGAIEQDADVVIFLMRPEYYGFMDEIEIGGNSYSPGGLVVTKIDKNRHGSTKNIALKFSPEIMRYSDYEKEYVFDNFRKIEADPF